MMNELAKPQLRSSMEEWLRELCESGRLAPKSVRSIGSLLRLVFRQAVKWGYLDHSPMDYVDLPQGSTLRKKQPRALAPVEYLQLIELYGLREQLAIKTRDGSVLEEEKASGSAGLTATWILTS
jgi:hypothetical protein